MRGGTLGPSFPMIRSSQRTFRPGTATTRISKVRQCKEIFRLTKRLVRIRCRTAETTQARSSQPIAPSAMTSATGPAHRDSNWTAASPCSCASCRRAPPSLRLSRPSAGVASWRGPGCRSAVPELLSCGCGDRSIIIHAPKRAIAPPGDKIGSLGEKDKGRCTALCPFWYDDCQAVAAAPRCRRGPAHRRTAEASPAPPPRPACRQGWHDPASAPAIAAASPVIPIAVRTPSRTAIHWPSRRCLAATK